MNDPDIVADASAVLAALKRERFDKVDPLRLVRSGISAVNLCEVLTKLAADGLTQEQAEAAVSVLDLRVFPFERRLAGVAAELWRVTRRAGLSLGDRACLALGAQLECAVVTADRAWADLDIGVEVLLLR